MRKILLAAGIAVAVLGAAALWYRPGGSAPAPTEGATATRSIAVLPFEGRGENPRGAYYGLGMSEDLRRALAKIEGLRVRGTEAPGAASGDARRIGLSLNVSSVLKGEVEVQGNRLRITATLIDVGDGEALWTQTFERDIEQVFALQDELSRAVAAALQLDGDRAGLAGAATDSIEAYDYYLVGRYHWHQRTPESLHRAVELFEKAIETDEEYALAYSGLADAYLLLKSYGNAQAEVADARAEAAISRALELNDRLAEAYASLGLMKLGTDALDEAQAAFARAIELNPDYAMAHMWLGNIHHARGNVEQAHQAYLAAGRVDPLHPTININLANTLGERGETQQAIDRLQRTLEANPGSAAVLRALGEWNKAAGRYEEAWRSARQAVEADGGAPMSVLTLAQIYLELGEFDAAQQWLRRARDAGPAHSALEWWGVELGAKLRLYRGEFEALQRFAEEGLAQATADSGAYARLAWAGVGAVLNERPAAAVSHLERLRAMAEGKQAQKDLSWAFVLLGSAYRQLGEPERAEELLREAERRLQARRAQGWRHPGMDVDEAAVLAAQGREQDALDALQRAVDAGWRSYWALLRDPRFAPLRQAPRFAQIAERVRRDLEQARARIAARGPAGVGAA